MPARPRLPLHRLHVSQGTFQKGTRWPFSPSVLLHDCRTHIGRGRSQINMACSWPFLLRSLFPSPREQKGGKTACFSSSACAPSVLSIAMLQSRRKRNPESGSGCREQRRENLEQPAGWHKSVLFPVCTKVVCYICNQS